MGICNACGSGSDSAPPLAPQGDSPSSPSVANSAPSISGEAGKYARVGTQYEFQPTVNDNEGDKLTFSSNNLPPWATLDLKTGRLAGTPDAGDVGAYEAIVITVADATHVVKTAEFEITVLGAATGVASLQWEIPAAKVDGSPLDNLAGYRILYGRSPDDLDLSVFIEGASVNTYEFSDLESGIWYFAVAAVNVNGLEGPPSIAAMKSI
ncbi:MAG TPA: putative Ig domain-containing protein [Steroidobacteraceae bacterium]|nr:putative Ig domain-containing protein [Steroidobacteraceae bacterium]